MKNEKVEKEINYITIETHRIFGTGIRTVVVAFRLGVGIGIAVTVAVAIGIYHQVYIFLCAWGQKFFFERLHMYAYGVIVCETYGTAEYSFRKYDTIECILHMDDCKRIRSPS